MSSFYVNMGLKVHLVYQLANNEARMVDIKWCGMVCGHQDKSELILHLSQLQFEFDLAGFTNDLYFLRKLVN